MADAELKTLMLRAPVLKLAVAESLTCGHLQAMIGRISGASEFFLGGITAYALEQKVRHLGVNRLAAARVHGVSATVAEEMARGACRMFGSDLGVATTGHAEPSAADGVVNPFAWWALAHRRGTRCVMLRSGRVEYPGARRVAAQKKVAEAVFAALLAYLRETRG